MREVGSAGTEERLGRAGRTGPELPLDRQADGLRDVARWARRLAVRRAHATGQGHIGGEFSVVDILVTLYCAVMRLPGSAGGPDPDRLILSKGHAAVALYAAMAAAGVLDHSRLRADGGDGLPGHPVKGSAPGIEATTGSLGHGLSLGVGAALGSRMDGSRARTFVVLGDGELQEGSNWEAFMLAAHLRLGNLTAVVDANGLQQGGRVSTTNGIEPLEDKMRAFGWCCSTVDGHDFEAMLGTLTLSPGTESRQPRVVVARTTKGYGVSFMADDPSWHHRIPTDDELVRALGELDG
ncbi:transketolase [Streptomyces sp. NPDC056465]|uniref:transketolase n=1 Tax=unclassified Streptomyces TaxID=2593676 RepID=UPI0036C83CFC